MNDAPIFNAVQRANDLVWRCAIKLTHPKGKAVLLCRDAHQCLQAIEALSLLREKLGGGELYVGPLIETPQK